MSCAAAVEHAIPRAMAEFAIRDLIYFSEVVAVVVILRSAATRDRFPSRQFKLPWRESDPPLATLASG
jgi:hypothetical protein